MRFIIYSVFLASWLFMWWWTYVYHIKACDTHYASVVDKESEFVLDAAHPLSFKWSDPTPVISGRFERWRDSIVNSLRQDQILHITGISYRDEYTDPMFELGISRARAIERLFSAKLPARKIQLGERTGELTGDLRNRNIIAFDIRSLTRNDLIWEMPGCTLMRFPGDTITQEIDKNIDPYLEHLILSIDTAGTWIKLRTIVNNDEPGANLLRQKMDTLRSKMVMKGMPADHVLLPDRDEVIPAGCIPEEFGEATGDWIALIFMK